MSDRNILSQKLKNRRNTFFFEMSLWSTALIIIAFFVPLNVRSLNLFGVVTYIIATVLAFYRFKPHELGFQNNFRTTLTPWILSSFLMILAVVVLKYFYPAGLFSGFSKTFDVLVKQLPFYIFFSAILQEVVFRGYFYRLSLGVFSQKGAVVSSIIIFSAFHLPYMVQLHSGLFYFSIASGTIWSILFAKYPNVYLAAFSHSIVGTCALLLLQRF